MEKELLSRLKEKRPDHESLAVIVLHTTFVLTPLLLAAITPLGWHHLLFWLWFGIAANGLTLLLHECAHGLPFKRRRMSDLFARWFLGPLLLTDFGVYRKRHWIHHRELGQPLDTKETYLTRIDGINALILILKILFLYEALQAIFRQFFQLKKRTTKIDEKLETVSVDFLPFLAFHFCFATILGACIWSIGEGSLSAWATHFAIVYGFVYLYGLASLTVLMAHIRAIAEHSTSVAQDGRVVGVAALRTMKANTVMKFIFGGYGFADHAAHHLYPGIPYYNLHEVSKRLGFENVEFRPTYGYLQLMWLGFRSRGPTQNQVH
jgi:fatty acid desaturase